jgi:hypothetical protein
MALINDIPNEPQNIDHPRVQGETVCTWSIIDGQFLQIDTYGGPDRQHQGKASQTLRFSPHAIQQLRAILNEHFPNE